MNKLKIEQDLLNGTLIREPVGDERGYWVGAPGWCWDESEKAAYLTYRIRRPRGVEPDRGGESRIAKTTDFETFKDVWSVHKDQYNSASIEKSCLKRGTDGQWRYFTSYVNPKDGRWCTTINKADSVEALDPANRKLLFDTAELGLEGIKDPWLIEVEGTYHLFLSVAKSTASTTDSSHDTLDIFNTGECVSATALATSGNLDDWEWQGAVLQPEGNGWDCYCRRINSVLPLNGRYYGFYDGSAGHHENYEEKTGLTVSDDLRHWEVLSPEGPVVLSPHASGSLRYIDAQHVGDQFIFIHELTRANGAHEMRMGKFPADGFALS
ncbi:MAG: hypothetical protein CMO74_05235 [Verrucomicrobiales bacterium]|nr:hypothetical protein [Verrucomicrobiales bacterium]|tara:strand:+ start:46500 stop:47471 length:972 start_codon:yes stop_codon:yes gene_type:complete